jgi:hypothetical protein
MNRKDILKERINKTQSHLNEGDWGMFTSSRRAKAELLILEGERKRGLLVYLEVLFLSSNGPTNHSRFDLNRATLPIGNINTVKNLIKEINITEHQTHDLFLSVNEPLFIRLEMPINPQDSWNNSVSPKLFTNY